MLQHKWFAHRLLLTTCLTAGLAAGCNGSSLGEEEEKEELTGVPVNFTASVPTTATRATDTDFTTDNLMSMGVLASYTGQRDWQSTDKFNFIFDEKVSRASNATPWTYSPVKYWPNTSGDKISFVAYAPHNDDSKGVFWARDRGIGFNIDFEIPAKESQQIDLLIADSIQNSQKGAPLKFTFRHAFAKIEFRVKSNMDIIAKSLSVTTAYMGMITFDRTYTIGRNFRETTSDRLLPLEIKKGEIKEVACFYLVHIPGTPKVSFTYQIEGTVNANVANFKLPENPPWLNPDRNKGANHVIYTITMEDEKVVLEAIVSDSSMWSDGPDAGGNCGSYP